MNKGLGFAFAVVMVCAQAFATSPMLPREVAPVLTKIEVKSVGRRGQVVRRDKMFPRETVLVGIPVRIQVPNACTTFVGQQHVSSRRVAAKRIPTDRLEAVGSYNPLTEACITIHPLPFDTTFTLPLVVNNESVPAASPVSKVIGIGFGAYLVTLNPKTEEVTILPVKTAK